MGQIQSRLCQLCHHSNCTLQLLPAKRTIQLASWSNAENYNTWIDALHRPSQWKEYCTQDTGYIPTIAFRTADGTAYRNPAIPLSKKECTNILQRANDWEVLMDEEHEQILFPPQITETVKRPDITIYSERTRTVIIIELTFPMEKNLSNAYARKSANTKTW